MRVLPVNYISYQSKTNNYKNKTNHSYQQSPLQAQSPTNFKGGNVLAAAGFFGAILGGAALVFAAPAAIVVGAFVTGALGGASMAEDDEPLNDNERYKYTHEC